MTKTTTRIDGHRLNRWSRCSNGSPAQAWSLYEMVWNSERTSSCFAQKICRTLLYVICYDIWCIYIGNMLNAQGTCRTRWFHYEKKRNVLLRVAFRVVGNGQVTCSVGWWANIVVQQAMLFRIGKNLHVQLQNRLAAVVQNRPCEK